MLVVFDLDGTLADLTHRLDYIRSVPKNWDAFHGNVGADKPIKEVMQMNYMHHDAGHIIVICSGRSDSAKEDTIKWLEEHLVGYHELKMRKDGDYTPDDVLKESMLQDIVEKYGKKPDLVYDDRQRVVDMWRKHKIRTFQVAKGNF